MGQANMTFDNILWTWMNGEFVPWAEAVCGVLRRNRLTDSYITTERIRRAFDRAKTSDSRECAHWVPRVAADNAPVGAGVSR
jgi:hypothetical protein